eukprot:symbB.v1.2.037857.t1/scaffold5711.1/size24326/2
MGYPRFGAIFALFFARLCLGTPFSLHGPEMQCFGIVLLAEITEDVLSYLLYHIGCNIFPRPRLLTEEAVQELAGQRIQRNSRRKGSKESVGGTSKENVAVVPSPSKNSKDTKNSKDSKGKDELSTTSDRTLLKSTCWKLRVAYDFRFRIDAFEEMPFWAHLLPTAMAQFHTILAMVAFSGGIDFIFGHEDAVTMVQQLFQSLEELSQSMQDDQVCHESESLELRQERNAIKDRLEEASLALRQLSAAAELLQLETSEAFPRGGGPASEAPEYQRRCQRAEGELQELKRMECLRLQQIKDLELDQESLVEQTTLATALPGEDANHKMANLERNYDELQASVQSKRHQLDETRQICQQLREYVRRLHEQQLQLVSRADERVLRNPQPSQAAATRA